MHRATRTFIRILAWAGLTAVTTAGAARALAGPHHFQHWKQGEIICADATHRRLLVRGENETRPTPLALDRSTTVFNRAGKVVGHGGTSDSLLLHPGDHVRVLYEKRGRECLARRIVPLPSTADAAKE